VPAEQSGAMLEKNHHIESLVLSRVNAKGKPVYEPI